MRLGPKYKIARRLGAPIFEKTQTQKFTLNQAKKSGRKMSKHPTKVTDYGLQVIEKQKARLSYLLTEKQFSLYVKKSLEHKGKDKVDFLFELLERRLDNTVFRIGLSKTRSASRQLVSHGHITVNGRKMTIPSYQVKISDKIGIRAGSKDKRVFSNIEEQLKNFERPEWIKFDITQKEAEIIGMPNLKKAGSQLYDLTAVLEFYSR